MATTFAEGTIRNILIKNIGNFKDFQELNLSGNNLVALVGGSSTGKSILLNAIAITYHLKLAYTVDQNNKTCLKVDRPKEQENQNGGRSATENEITTHTIHKFNKNEESLLMVESSDAEERPVYYGLYADKDEKSWCWHHKQDISYRYSSMFFYSHHDGKFYLLSPQKIIARGTTDKLVEEFNVHFQDTGKLENVYSEIANFLGKHSEESPEHMLKCLPNDKMNLLPAKVKTFLRPSFKVIKEYAETQQSLCLLLENPVCEVAVTDRIPLMISLGDTKKQIIFTNTTEEALAYSSIIRHWQTSSGTWLARRINNEIAFIDQCYKLRFSAILILCSHVCFLTEGQTDVNVLWKLQEQWKEGKYSYSTENAILKKLRVHIERVDGKFNFPSATSLFLDHAYLGLAHLIVCDGDCLTGGSHKDVRKNREKTLSEPHYGHCSCTKAKGSQYGPHKQCEYKDNCHCPDRRKGQHSVIACNNIGVLREVTNHIWDYGVKSLHTQLWNDLRKFDYSCNAKLSSAVMFRYLKSKTDVPTEELLWDFSESYLNTFAWNKGENFDLESALKLSTTKDNKKIFAYRPKDLTSKIEESDKEEVERLYRFICEHLQTIYCTFTDLSKIA